MWRQFCDMTAKQQVGCVLELVLGYFWPILGVAIFIFMRVKKKNILYQISPLLGIALAVVFYAVAFIYTYI